jgi:DNA-binding winged helix-turn-helix (wHTH) protein/tetratricopeptide (TPR) repeat protein
MQDEIRAPMTMRHTGEGRACGELLLFGTFVLDLPGHSLRDDSGREVPLTPAEFALLTAFLRSPTRVLSREHLLLHVAGREAESYDRSIDVLVGRVRRKIEANPKRPQLILTVPRSGYKFAIRPRISDPEREDGRTQAGNLRPASISSPRHVAQCGTFTGEAAPQHAGPRHLPGLEASANRGDAWRDAHIERLNELSKGQQALLAAINRERGTPYSVLAQILQRLGETTVISDPSEIERKLQQRADDYVALREELAKLSGDDPHVHQLRQEAQVALGDSDFARARAKLQAAADIDAAAVDAMLDRARSRALSAAANLEQSAHVARLTLRYPDAAIDLGRAAGLVGRFEQREAWRLTVARADALQAQGSEFGDNGALTESINGYTDALRLVTRAKRPVDWATTQSKLGDALRILGARESSTARLEEAVAAYRAVLEEMTQDRAPLDWARTLNKLGLALVQLGQRDAGSERLEQAVAAHRAALEVLTRDRWPLEWAEIQNNAGRALWRLGERKPGRAWLEQSVAALQAALEIQTRERVPLAWADIQNNLGLTLWRLGEREASSTRLEQGVAAFRAALEVRTRERLPLDWAETQNNLAVLLWVFGEQENNAQWLAEAVVTCRAALQEWDRKRVPLDWARAQNTLGNALRRLGERENSAARLEEAVAAYRASLEERTLGRIPYEWAKTLANLADALRRLGERESGTARLEEAVAAYENVLGIWRRDLVPVDWARTFGGQSLAMMVLANRRADLALALTAVERLETAHAVAADGGHANAAAYLAMHIPEARALAASLDRTAHGKSAGRTG